MKVHSDMPVMDPVAPNTAAQALARATIEVSTRQKNADEILKAHLAPGTGVNVTFLPNDERDSAADMISRVARAGFKPIPHLTARSFASREELDQWLARLSGDAGVNSALLLAGDVDAPRGPYAATLDLMQSGLLQKHGVLDVWVAGHPEGHPKVARDIMDAALLDKLAFARANGLSAGIVTQFCFEAEPVHSFVARVREAGFDAPVRVGVAGPASAANLLKFGMLCGVGNSLRALRSQGSRLVKLLGDTTPDELIGEIFEGPAEKRPDSVHIYVFGGLEKTGKWLNAARAAF
jgi:methylenetetrahydrofolate reductase (NADPH)